MRTARLRHQMSALMWEGGPEANKFEQVFIDGHQMSIAGWEGVPVK